MTYDIFKRTAPAMPNPGKGTKIVGFLLSKASKDMQEVLVPMIMPALSSHLAEVQFQYSDNKYYGMSGQMGHLIGPSGVGKAQLTHLVEAVMRIFSDMLNLDEGSLHEVGRGGPKNMLEDLPDSFNEAQLEALRLEAGKTKEGTKPQLRKWVFRKFVTYSAQTGLYTKTAEYLKG